MEPTLCYAACYVPSFIESDDYVTTIKISGFDKTDVIARIEAFCKKHGLPFEMPTRKFVTSYS